MRAGSPFAARYRHASNAPSVCANSATASALRQVASDDADIGELVPADELVESGRLVVNRDDLPVARRAQQHVVPDESRRAGDENLHRLVITD